MKMDDFFSRIQDTAAGTRVLVATALWYRPERLPYFLDAMRTLRDFPVAEMKIVIHTNTTNQADIDTLARLLSGYESERFSFEIRVFQDPPFEYNLCWQHRNVIKEEFLNIDSKYTHFIYLEDDIRFSYMNFCYFLFFREFLRPHGLLPAFVRAEFNKNHLEYCATDTPEVMDFAQTHGVFERKQIRFGDHLFVPFENSYMGMYALDRELGQEYIESRSFDRERSKEVLSWGTPERAAAGLCRENPPPGYVTRYVMPVDAVSLVPACCAWIYHLPNNFTDQDDPKNPFGQLPMTALFAPTTDSTRTTPRLAYNIPRAYLTDSIPAFATSALATSPSLSDFLARIDSPARQDAVVVHAPRTNFGAPERALKRNTNWFGVADAQAVSLFRDGSFRMQESETVLLHDAIVSPQSTVVCSLSRGFYEPSIANFRLASKTLAPLARNDPLFRLTESGACTFTERVEQLPYSDTTAMPICGTGFHNYGHFLYDGLPLVYQICLSLRAGAAVIVGPKLSPWQQEILEFLGIADRYEAIPAPVVFSRVVVTSHISLHVPYPTRFIRPLIDRMRFVAGAGGGPTRRIFVSRSQDREKRLLLNRETVEAVFRERGFEILHPEQMSVAEQIAAFSQAAVVAGESGAGMANVAFCDPGTRVLEIQPEAFVEGWTRAACMLFGHDWHVYFARCPNGAERVHDHRIDFFVDTNELRAAITALGCPG